MVTDRQVKRLMELLRKGRSLAAAAAKADMDEKTACKYRRLKKLPSEVRVEHTWRTREDPFADVWTEIKKKLKINPGLEAKTLFEDLQRRYPGRCVDGQLRTLQRRVKAWRALEGPPKEVFFAQVHKPGQLVHHSVILELNLPSYRLEQSKANKEPKNKGLKPKQ